MGSTGLQSLAIGMDVGSTTVKAVVVDPATKEILWSDYQRHHTKQPEYVLEMLESDPGRVPGSAGDGGWRMFLTGLGLRAALRADGRQVRPGGERGHARGRAPAPRRRLGHRARRARRQDHHVQEGREDRREDRRRLDERQVRVRHGRHHRQVLPQGERAAGARDDRSTSTTRSSTTSPPSAASSPRRTSST